MILLTECYRLLSFVIIRWQESGENLAFFCYLILWGACSTLWFRALVPILNSERADSACSNRFFTFSAPSTIPKGLEN
jgi:hypothetical protein